MAEDSAYRLYCVLQDRGDSWRTIKRVGADGRNPVYDGVILGAPGYSLWCGDCWMPTVLGGDLACGGKLGCGTVFKIDSTGKESVLHSFRGLDGAYPNAAVIRDSAGNLYGTTNNGGATTHGTVFKIAP